MARKANTKPNNKKGSKSSKKKRGSKGSQKNIYIALVVIVVVAVSVGLYLIKGQGGGASSGGVPGDGKEVTTASGLKYVDEVVGNGPSPKPGETVTVNYVGTLENGTKFDSSYDRNQPYSFRIGRGGVIKGWDEGVMTMKVGGKRRLIVPPDLAYGASGRPGIPPNSTLIFEVELLSVQ